MGGNNDEKDGGMLLCMFASQLAPFLLSWQTDQVFQEQHLPPFAAHHAGMGQTLIRLFSNMYVRILQNSEKVGWAET